MTQSVLSLSVVLVPLVGGRALQEVADRLLGEGGLPANAELVVVGPEAPSLADRRIQHEPAPEDTTVPGRRAHGIARTKGDVVALVEDTVLPAPGWARATLDLHGAHPEAAAIGGTLSITPDLPARSTALLLLENGRYLANGPVSATAASLPGSNLSFKRDALAGGDRHDASSLREVEIEVLPLPREGRPASFSGFVGRLESGP